MGATTRKQPASNCNRFQKQIRTQIQIQVQLVQMSGSGDRSNMTPPSSEDTSQDPMELDQATSASQEISDPEVEVEEEEMMCDKLKKYLWEKLVKLGKAVYQMIIWLLYLLGSCLGILWIVFNMWICSLVSTEFEKLGAGRDGSFIIGMTVRLLDYSLAWSSTTSAPSSRTWRRRTRASSGASKPRPIKMGTRRETVLLSEVASLFENSEGGGGGAPRLYNSCGGNCLA